MAAMKGPPTVDMKLQSILEKAGCRHVDLAKKDLAAALKQFGGLNAAMGVMMSSQWTHASLKGTIPVTFKGSVYNIEITVHLMGTHPYIPPLCMVRRTPDMTPKATKYVDQTGRVNLPYLAQWRYPGCSLVGLLQTMTVAFGEDLPVARNTAGRSGSAPMPYPPHTIPFMPMHVPRPRLPYPRSYGPHLGWGDNYNSSAVVVADQRSTQETPESQLLRRQNAVLQSNADGLCTSLHPDLIITQLRVKGIINGPISQIVHRETTDPAKIILLLDLMAPNPKFFDAVVEFLNQNGFTPLKSKLEKELSELMH